jgi:hypothetical protein|tara:strand:+ start:221 stop:649 length:429 start_codon:yes stop_codon:yes gene_type:complete
MKDLVEKLEQATEGSRELDVAVFLSTTETRLWKPDDTKLQQRFVGHDFLCWENEEQLCDRIPHFTTSLDAALTLVPGRVGKIETTVYRLVAEKTIVNLFDTQLDFKEGQVLLNVACGAGRSKNPALALCIAALKARTKCHYS